MFIAQIHTDTGMVANLLVADEVLVDATGEYTYIAYTDANPAHIGYTWQPIGGFEQPPAPAPWPDDYVPPEADPAITVAEFEAALAKHNDTRR